MESRTSQWWQPCLWIVVIAVILVAFLATGVSCSDGGQPAATTQAEGVSNTPALTNLPVPDRVHHYESGDVLVVNSGTAALCKTVDDYGPDKHCGSVDQLYQDNYVQITGPVVLLINQDEEGEQWGWYWQSRVIYGGMYVEGQDWLISDEADLRHDTLGPRPVPDFVAGEVVLLGANFQLYDGPGGVSLGIYVYGSDYATIITGPALGPDLDADGGTRYWCEIKTETSSRPPSWVPSCEFQRT